VKTTKIGESKMSKANLSDLVNGLHELADYIESHPNLPYDLGYGESQVITYDTYIYGGSGEDNQVTLPDVARMMGKCDKDVDGYDFSLTRTFGNGSVGIKFESPRSNVCTKRVIGKKQVKKKVPVEYETKIVEEDEIEWSCPESLLAKSE
jgi:hypothetical protein